MRAVILGAAGSIGRHIAAGLSEADTFEELLLADVDAGRARSVAAALPGPVRAARVDVAAASSLRSIFRRGDVVVNCTGYRHGLTVLRTAIAGRCDYVDLGGLYTTPRQLELDARARRAGIRAVIGCGATPGLSNVMVRAAADRLDRVEEVHIAFASHRDLAPSPGLLDTLLDEFRPEVTRFTWTRGRLHEVRAFDGEREVRFAPPLGKQLVYFVPHSETYTIPRSLGDGVREVSVRGTWRPEDMRRLRDLADLGLTSETPVRVDGRRIRPLDVVRSVLLERRPVDADGLCAFFLHVAVHGRRDGRATTIVRRASHPLEWRAESTARMTAVPAIVGAGMIAGGHVARPGVVPPEQAFDPGPFLAEVGRLGVAIGR